MSTRPSKDYPPELRERAIRMVGEVRAEYTSDWAAVCSVATKLGIGAPQTLMNWVRKAQVDAGQRAGVSSAGGRRAAPAARRGEAATHGERDIAHGERIFAAAELDRRTGLIVDYIDAHRGKVGAVPICRVLTEHGMPIAPSTFYDAPPPVALAGAASRGGTVRTHRTGPCREFRRLRCPQGVAAVEL